MDKNCTTLDEDNGAGGEVREKGGMGTKWRGALGGKKRNNCTNLNN